MAAALLLLDRMAWLLAFDYDADLRQRRDGSSREGVAHNRKTLADRAIQKKWHSFQLMTVNKGESERHWEYRRR